MQIHKLQTNFNSGFILDKLPKDIIDIIQTEINNQVIDVPVNNTLAGCMKKEYKLIIKNQKVIDYIIDRSLWLDAELDGEQPELEVQDIWINYQAKHEFNPCHSHSGTYSFVIWWDIPFSIENELELFKDSRSNYTSQFMFLYPKDNRVAVLNLPVDNTWNGTIAIFPSKLDHAVNPFYTSDKYRITIAGNLQSV